MSRRGLVGLAPTFAFAFALAGAWGCTKEQAEAPASGPGAETASAKTAALCAHQVPQDICALCNPELAQTYKDLGDWCAEHGRPESQCFACNPDLAFAAGGEKDWCREHGVPESRCTRCNPSLVERYIAEGDYCRTHRLPQSVCPLCDPQRALAAGEEPPPFPLPGTKVKLASSQTAKDMDLRTVPARRGGLAQTLEVPGRLTFDQTRHAQLSARGDGVVLRTFVDVGDEVKRGQALVELGSAVAGSDEAQRAAGQAAVDAARSSLERERALASRGVSARRDVEEAERAYAEAKANLSQVGSYRLTAPFAGTVVALQAVTGRTAGSGEVLVEVADPSILWAQLDVPEAQASLVRAGQKARLFLQPGAPPREATLSRVAPSVDPHTRTVTARVVLPNDDGTLRAGAFLRAEITVEAAGSGLLIPKEAVQRAEGRDVVFVQRGPFEFEPLAVEVGARQGDWVEVRSGLEEGAQVVTRGAFLLKTELLKDSIGAGCCEVPEG